jgi:hypothetical protein
MKQKRDIHTRKFKKYKARLNIDGSHIKKGSATMRPMCQ